MASFFLKAFDELLKHNSPGTRCSPLQHLGLNIVCVKNFVGSGKLFDYVVFYQPRVVASVRFIPPLYREFFHLFVDRVIESVLETKLGQVLSVKKAPLSNLASSLFSNR